MGTRLAAGPKPGVAELDRAIEVFFRAFAFCRGFTHPSFAERVGGLWVVRDAPRTRKSDDVRREEWVARGDGGDGGDAAEIDRVVRANAKGRFHICYVRTPGQPMEPVRDAFKRLGYRFQLTEPLMHHRLERIPRASADVPVTIQHVRTIALAADLALAARQRQVLPEHLTASDPPVRQYVAMDEQRAIVGWVRSIVIPAARRGGGHMTWVSNLYVRAEQRRRGIGRALLVRLLRDDRAAGSTVSVLTASHTGALLYPRVGYEQVGELLVFIPPRG